MANIQRGSTRPSVNINTVVSLQRWTTMCRKNFIAQYTSIPMTSQLSLMATQKLISFCKRLENLFQSNNLQINVTNPNIIRNSWNSTKRLQIGTSTLKLKYFISRTPLLPDKENNCNRLCRIHGIWNNKHRGWLATSFSLLPYLI